MSGKENAPEWKDFIDFIYEEPNMSKTIQSLFNVFLMEIEKDRRREYKKREGII